MNDPLEHNSEDAYWNLALLTCRQPKAACYLDSECISAAKCFVNMYSQHINMSTAFV